MILRFSDISIFNELVTVTHKVVQSKEPKSKVSQHEEVSQAEVIELEEVKPNVKQQVGQPKDEKVECKITLFNELIQKMPGKKKRIFLRKNLIQFVFTQM